MLIQSYFEPHWLLILFALKNCHIREIHENKKSSGVNLTYSFSTRFRLFIINFKVQIKYSGASKIKKAQDISTKGLRREARKQGPRAKTSYDHKENRRGDVREVKQRSTAERKGTLPRLATGERDVEESSEQQRSLLTRALNACGTCCVKKSKVTAG